MTALDTNVLIYACDKSDPRRQQIALELIATVTDGGLLWQVACEFVADSRKLNDRGFTPIDAWNRLTEFLGYAASVTCRSSSDAGPLADFAGWRVRARTFSKGSPGQSRACQ